mgnify:CR=1 FL=1
MKINMSNINVGIDLGGSHVAIGVVNNEGKILEQFEKDYTVKEKENTTGHFFRSFHAFIVCLRIGQWR